MKGLKRGNHHLLVGHADRQNLRRTNSMSVLGADMLINLQYNGANYPEAAHTQLWLNDLVVKKRLRRQDHQRGAAESATVHGSHRLSKDRPYRL